MVLGKLTMLDMTLMGWLGCKISTQSKSFKSSPHFGSKTKENFQNFTLVCVKVIPFWLHLCCLFIATVFCTLVTHIRQKLWPCPWPWQRLPYRLMEQFDKSLNCFLTSLWGRQKDLFRFFNKCALVGSYWFKFWAQLFKAKDVVS